MSDKLLGLLGLARRAGKITFGLDAAIKDIVERKAKVVFSAIDASPRSLRTIERVCLENNIELINLTCSMSQLGASIGRSDTAVLAVTDYSFAKKAKEICHAN